jgi:uncharacterized protein (TIGR03083 family)
MLEPEVSATLYRDARRRIIAVARDLDAAQLTTPVPACPRWTVRDLLAHLAGGTADVVNNNLVGAPSDEWTDAHVAARADRGVPELLAEWDEFGPRWEEMARRAEHPSFIVRNPYLDAGVHEADLYGALRLARQPAEIYLAITASVVPRVAEDFDGIGVFTIITPEREYRLGDGDADASVRVDSYELSRAVFGRRSRVQIESWDWIGPPGQFAERLTVMPQTKQDLVD